MESVEVEITSDGRTVWVNDSMGHCIGRFSKVFGLDVHNAIDVMSDGGLQCLHCEHGESATWELFIEKMMEHHGVNVPLDTLEKAGAEEGRRE